MKRWLLLVIMMLSVASATLSARAQDESTQDDYLITEDHIPRVTDLVEAEYISAILHPALMGTGTKTEIPFVLKFALKDGWYMYWRTPGDSGLAPTFDWSTSQNVADVSIGWPAPKRFEQDGMYSFGYDGIVEMPVTVTLDQMGQPLAFNLDTSLIVCNKICVPQKLMITADMEAMPSTGSPYDEYYDAIKNKLPLKDGDNNMQMQTAVLGKAAIVVTVYAKDGFDGMDIFVESDTVNFTAKPVMEKDPGNPSAAIFRIEAPEGTDDLTKTLLGKTVTVTAVKGPVAIEKQFSF